MKALGAFLVAVVALYVLDATYFNGMYTAEIRTVLSQIVRAY